MKIFGMEVDVKEIGDIVKRVLDGIDDASGSKDELLKKAWLNRLQKYGFNSMGDAEKVLKNLNNVLENGDAGQLGMMYLKYKRQIGAVQDDLKNKETGLNAFLANPKEIDAVERRLPKETKKKSGLFGFGSFK